MSRLTVLVFLVLSLLGTARDATGQVVNKGGGCVPVGGGTPNTPFAENNEPPRIGNGNFALVHITQPNTIACFFLMALASNNGTGSCTNPSVVNWDAFAVCGTGCGRVVPLTTPMMLDGRLLPPAPARWPLPIPDATTLSGVSVCVQFLSFSDVSCTEISGGIKITLHT